VCQDDDNAKTAVCGVKGQTLVITTSPCFSFAIDVPPTYLHVYFPSEWTRGWQDANPYTKLKHFFTYTQLILSNNEHCLKVLAVFPQQALLPENSELSNASSMHRF
jgi:hypothetical protein